MKQFLSFLLCCTLTLSSPVLAAENSEADLSVSAPSVLLMEASTGTVVYEKNAHEIRHPASITKIMTTLLALENCSLDEMVHFGATAVYENEGGTSHIARDLDEEMTLEQCYYAGVCK